jgi:SAM-dependent methyltransferase
MFETKIIKRFMSLNDKVKKKLFGLRDFEGAYIISKLLGNKKKILNIGCLWGREYFFLSSVGKEVTNIDLGAQDVPSLVVGDISKKTSFKDGEFDGVVMGEILEHLFEDVAALKEIRRILKNDGYLVVTVPFYDDQPEYHVRMHSANTIRRLLEYSGFKPISTIMRGGLISLSKIFAIPSLFLGLFSEPLRLRYLQIFSEWDFRLGRKNCFLFKASKSYGCYILAKKSKNIDFVQINRKEFTGKK